MNQLNANEARILGVLIEKAATTPDQYPLSLNAATNGANQKNNRDPVLNLVDDEVFDALEGLREKGLVVRVDVQGNRVHKYRQNAGEVLQARPGEVAILAELMLRGPQTLGELRGRADRMSPMESLQVVEDLLRALMTRGEPLVQELPPIPGTRAIRFRQLLCEDSHPNTWDGVAVKSQTASTVAPTLGDRVTALEEKVAGLTAALKKLAEQLGESDLPL